MHTVHLPGSSVTSLQQLVEHSTWGCSLSAVELARVLDSTTECSVAAGSAAVKLGDEPRHWMGVVHGLLKMSVSRPDGRVSTLAGAGQGGWFGEGSLLKREPYRYDVIALRDSRIAQVPRATFEWLRSHSLAFNHYLQHLLNARLGMFVSLLEYDRLLGAEARVARCLATLYNPDLNPAPGPFLDLLQGEVALLTGISRQTANRVLGHLAELDLISIETRGITILDVEGLRRYEPSGH